MFISNAVLSHKTQNLKIQYLMKTKIFSWNFDLCLISQSTKVFRFVGV